MRSQNAHRDSHQWGYGDPRERSPAHSSTAGSTRRAAHAAALHVDAGPDVGALRAADGRALDVGPPVPGDQDQEQALDRPDPWRIMYNRPDNRGTDPHLTSAKYTGYGSSCERAPERRMSCPSTCSRSTKARTTAGANQPDSGTGNPSISMRTARPSSHNGKEDTGDRAHAGYRSSDQLRAPGRTASSVPSAANVLDRPLYNLDVAQFAELAAGPYSTPEYLRPQRDAGWERPTSSPSTTVFNEAIPHRFSPGSSESSKRCRSFRCCA